MEDGGEMGQIINDSLNLYGPQIFNEVSKSVTPYFEEAIKNEINKSLSNMRNKKL